MLLKLMKYDLKSILKKMVFYYVSLLVLAIVSKVLTLIFADTKFAAIAALPTGILFIGLYACLFVTMIISMIRYYKNMLSDEGYLTHTLPVKRHTILFSKIISTLIVEVISVLIIVLCACIYSFTSVKLVISEIFIALNLINYDFATICLVVLVIFEIMLVGVSQLTLVALCLSIGACFNKNKILMSFVTYIVIHIIVQIILGTIISITAIVVISIESMEISLLYWLIIIYILITICYIALTYFINLIILNHKLNLQ